MERRLKPIDVVCGSIMAAAVVAGVLDIVRFSNMIEGSTRCRAEVSSTAPADTAKDAKKTTLFKFEDCVADKPRPVHNILHRIQGSR